MEIPTGTDPLLLLKDTLSRAAEGAPVDYTAGTLATVGSGGQPTARIVLLKSVDSNGLVFFTNYQGRKGRELTAHPQACLNYWWPWIGQQVRVDGIARKIDAAESDAYFASRARASQIGAWASHQSEQLASRDELLQRVQDLEQLYKNQPVPRPPHWGGFRLVPHEMEFWYDGEYRLHDRFLFRRQPDGWDVVRLNP
jgi:pyridoxamine 5'-phosphate oxidase